MIRIFNLIFLSLNFFSSFSNSQIINNPNEIPGHLNIVNYTFILEYIINESGSITEESQMISPKQNLNKLYYESYIYGSNFFIFTDLSNNNFLLIDNKYFSMKTENGEYTFSDKKELDSQYMYIGYFPRYGKDDQKQIILYATNDNNDLYFINLNSDNNKNTININLDKYDGYISCKIMEKKLIICAYSVNYILNLKVFTLSFQSQNKDIKIERSYPDIEIRDIIDLFDTDTENYKILCSRNKTNYEIKCFKIDISYYKQGKNSITASGINVTPLLNIDIFKYNVSFSYKEDNCNYTIFHSEYLLCCGKTDHIICERRDMELNLMDKFKIYSLGKITNLTIQRIDEEAVKLSYTNKSSEDKNIYEYYIYPPKCNNSNYLELSHYQSKNLSLDELFERKTNTNYYITFNKIVAECGEFYINNELIKENIKNKLSMNENN